METESTKEKITPPNRQLNPFLEVWSIAWPTILTMVSFTVMQFVDKLMVSKVGPLEVAAQGNAGTWSFAMIATVMGVVTVVNTYVSQNLGAKRPEAGSKYPWAAMWMSLGMWFILLVPWAFFLPSIFESIHSGEHLEEATKLIELESSYAVITILGSVFLLVGRGFSQYFFGMHMPKIITVSTIIANTINVVANYLFIFGEEGMDGFIPGIPNTPALGLTGAAYGTVVGMFVEMAIPAGVFLSSKFNTLYQTRRPWRPCFTTCKELFRLGWPGAIQWGNEIICWALFMTVFVGHFGTNDMTAGWIALGYLNLSFMPAIGLNVAVNSIVGKYIGAGKPEVAISRARVGVCIAMVYMTVCAALFVLFREEMISWFVSGTDVIPEQKAEIIAIGSKFLILVALFQTVDALGIVYSGALRGAGDTVWPGVVTALCSWTFIVGGGWVAVEFFPEFGSIGPWIAAAVYIILIGILMVIRFESGKWREIDLLKDPDRIKAAQTAPITIGPPATEADATVADLGDHLAD
ncbi:MAG: MATE family efflux transporter [Phycisphaerales bacterium]|jgi:MATE family multidrug resistance protein|nr:MATE family efflux transporter [Phycisphaerales bacterium]